MIEDLIYKALNSIEGLIPLLALHNGEPAIFYQEAPHDVDPGWGESQFPRVNYMVDWQYNAERKSEGTVAVDLWCLNNQEVSAEDLSIMIQSALSELFMTDQSGTYEMVWNRSDYFEGEGEKDPKIVGYTILFDILAFPNQQALTPSPVWALNSFIKKIEENAKVIGYDTLDELWRPSESAPAVYVRIASNDFSRSSYAVAWLKAVLNVHVIAPDPNARLNLLQKIIHELSLAGEAITDDGSPFFVQQIKHSMSTDPLRVGQMTVTGEYGVLPKEPDVPLLLNANFNRGEVVVNGKKG